MTDAINIQLRSDTAANWAVANPILLSGEAGLETDTQKIKFGDGSTKWSDLTYWFNSSGSSLAIGDAIGNSPYPTGILLSDASGNLYNDANLTWDGESQIFNACVSEFIVKDASGYANIVEIIPNIGVYSIGDIDNIGNGTSRQVNDMVGNIIDYFNSSVSGAYTLKDICTGINYIQAYCNFIQVDSGGSASAWDSTGNITHYLGGEGCIYSIEGVIGIPMFTAEAGFEGDVIKIGAGGGPGSNTLQAILDGSIGQFSVQGNNDGVYPYLLINNAIPETGGLIVEIGDIVGNFNHTYANIDDVNKKFDIYGAWYSSFGRGVGLNFANGNATFGDVDSVNNCTYFQVDDVNQLFGIYGIYEPEDPLFCSLFTVDFMNGIITMGNSTLATEGHGGYIEFDINGYGSEGLLSVGGQISCASLSTGDELDIGGSTFNFSNIISSDTGFMYWDGYNVDGISKLSAYDGTQLSTTSGGTITSLSDTRTIIINATSTLSSATIVFPPNPISHQQFTISSLNAITSLTLSVGTGSATINGGITTMTSNGFASWEYNGTVNKWVRIG